MTIHGRGNSVRHFLSVNDFCDGLIKILDKAGTNFYTKNIENVINKNSWGTFVDNWEEFISIKKY